LSLRLTYVLFIM